MHVVHCPDEQVDLVGLPNLLPIVSQCLNGDFPEALLLTDVFLTQFEDRERSLAKSLEMKLCCPLKMMPTVYNVRLLDHLNLGSSTCPQLHDYFLSRTTSTLKWYKAQINYSPDILLEVSTALKNVITALVNNCFIEDAIKSYYSTKEKNTVRYTKVGVTLFEAPR